ncbi:MAG: signal peptidase I [Thermosynechococcaceae cyanobacterium]
MSNHSQRQPTPPTPQTINETEESWWVEAVKTVGLSLLLAFGIRTFVAEARYIPSGSMEPTLQINDRLIIDKVSYDFRKPTRGDIIVFNPTKTLQEQDFKDAFIKRIVGLPGDRVEVTGGKVLINNRPLQELYVANGDDTVVDNECLVPPDKSIPAFLKEPQTIPAGSYLALGDNRHNSYDGRCWGLVSTKFIVGRAVFRFWPLHRIGTIPEPKLSDSEQN